MGYNSKEKIEYKTNIPERKGDKMSKKEIIEKLKQNMPEFTGTEEEKGIKTALYIYTELGKTKSFDERYYFGNRKNNEKNI